MDDEKEKSVVDYLKEVAESNRRIEDKLARIEVAYIELLAKIGKGVK